MRLPPSSTLIACSLLALFAELHPGVSRAADPGPASDDTAIEEEQALRHEVIEWKGTERLSVPRPRLLDPRRWSLEWEDGIELSREDLGLRFRFGGRYLGDVAGVHLGGGLQEATGGSAWESDLTTRQGRISAGGVFFDRFFATAAYEFKTQEVIDLFFGVHGLGPLGTLELGYMREPFSLELRTSFLTQTFMERSLAQALSPGRNYGVLFTNTHCERRLLWSLGAFYVVDEFGGFDDVRDSGESADVAFRVNGLPIWADEGRRLLLVGLSYSHRSSIQDDISFSTRPESFLAPALVDTGAITDARDLDRWGVEAAWVDGPFSLQAEVLGLHVARREGADLFFSGGYAQVSWFPTGERRIYGPRSGTFGRVVPRHPFNPSAGRWGAVELAGRLSYVDLDDADVSGGRELNATLGVNWILQSYARLEANYVMAWARNEGVASIIQARIQIDY